MPKWPAKRIGDLCRLATGGTPSRAKPEFFGGDIPWLVSGDINRGEIFECDGRITDAGMRSCNAKLLPKDSVMIALNGQGKTRATVALLRMEATCNQSLVCLSPKDHSVLLPEFLYANLHGRYEELRRLTSDDDKDRRGLNMGIIREIEVPVPPVSEQRRIVAILDEAFEAISTAKANTEKNLQNAGDVFSRHLQRVFDTGSPDWARRTLGEVCEFENGDRGKNYPNRNEYVDTGIPWINTGHIQPDGTLSMNEMNFITREKFNSLRGGKIQSGDLVYCLRGATLGKTALVDPLTEGAIASSLVIIRPLPSLDSRFLYFFLTSPPGQALIKGFENGAAQPNLGARSVAKYPIAIPPAAEQQRIVEALTELRETSQELANLCRRKLFALDELKRSLLNQAFTGQLAAKSTDQQLEAVT